MPIIFRRVCILFLWMCGVSMGIGAEGLISLKVMPLSAAAAAKAEARPFLAETPPLEGAAAGCQPLVAVTHYDSIWVLALNPSGSQVWLEHNTRLGWRLRSAPPAVIRPELQAGGQAHLLAIATPENRAAVLYTYHAITDTWATVGRVPLTGTLTGVRPSEGGFILATRGADGVEQFNQLTIALTKRLLNWIDWLIIVTYLVGTASIGFYYYQREQKQSGEEFFLGGRSIPWWAAGVSLYATGTSAISYIATPAKAFAENWLYLAANIVGIIGTAFTAIWIVPLLRRLNLMSVYHYLEMRYHPRIRTLASALAIVIQLGGRMSIVLFLPSLAMSAVTGLNVTYSILIMGVVTILYTVLGGMRAVIWTDFIQVVVMLGGAFVALGFVVTRIDGGAGAFFKTAMGDGKFRTFDWAFDLTQPTVWGFLLVTALGIMTIPQDQVMMQRVLATKSDKEAGWSMWTLAAIVIPGNLTFFGIGTALYVYYKHYPSHLNPMLNVDSTFPQFIAAELPAGITGLIIAGIFAASMSTLSSCMNSVATLVSVDFFERYGKKITPLQSVRIAEITTVAAGVVGIGTALLLATVNIKSALDANFELMALLGGGFAGCYALGLFTRRTNWQGVMIGVLASFVFTFLAWKVSLVHPFFYMPLAVLSCCVVGYLASFLFPAPAQSLTGLTIYTINTPRQAPVTPAST